AIPRGRRRRGCLLAVAAARLDAGLQSGGGGLAPSPQFGARLFAPAERLRQSGGLAGKEMAGKIQRGRSPEMGGPGLRNPLCAMACRPHLSRYLGPGALPVALRTGSRRDRFAAGDARMVPAGRGSERALLAQPSLVPVKG